MTDTEHAKHFAQDSISLATSMTNPQAESIAMFSCLHGLTFKKKEIKKLRKKLFDINIASIWYRTKQNELNKYDIKQALNHIMYTMQELAQVGAVVMKIKNTLKGENA